MINANDFRISPDIFLKAESDEDDREKWRLEKILRRRAVCCLYFVQINLISLDSEKKPLNVTELHRSVIYRMF